MSDRNFINEIILYQTNELTEHIEVRIENDTVWLTQQQMAILFGQTKQNISLHINNCFKEKELNRESVVKESLTTAKDGKQYKTGYYNLDVIISVGYRVKSKQGTLFRIWANRVLKEYLLKGYSINNRMNRIEDNVEELKNKVNQIDVQISSHLIPTQGIFYDGQVFDAYVFVNNLVKTAKKSIVLIDNYIDESVLVLFSERRKGTSVTILTKTITKKMDLDVQKFNEQYPPIVLKHFDKAHDRFLIIDKNTVYHFGASLKDLGRKWFAFSKMDISILTILKEVEELI